MSNQGRFVTDWLVPGPDLRPAAGGGDSARGGTAKAPAKDPLMRWDNISKSYHGNPLLRLPRAAGLNNLLSVPALKGTREPPRSAVTMAGVGALGVGPIGRTVQAPGVR